MRPRTSTHRRVVFAIAPPTFITRVGLHPRCHFLVLLAPERSGHFVRPTNQPVFTASVERLG